MEEMNEDEEELKMTIVVECPHDENLSYPEHSEDWEEELSLEYYNTLRDAVIDYALARGCGYSITEARLGHNSKSWWQEENEYGHRIFSRDTTPEEKACLEKAYDFAEKKMYEEWDRIVKLYNLLDENGSPVVENE